MIVGMDLHGIKKAAGYTGSLSKIGSQSCVLVYGSQPLGEDVHSSLTVDGHSSFSCMVGDTKA